MMHSIPYLCVLCASAIQNHVQVVPFNAGNDFDVMCSITAAESRMLSPAIQAGTMDFPAVACCPQFDGGAPIAFYEVFCRRFT